MVIFSFKQKLQCILFPPTPDSSNIFLTLKGHTKATPAGSKKPSFLPPAQWGHFPTPSTSQQLPWAQSWEARPSSVLPAALSQATQLLHANHPTATILRHYFSLWGRAAGQDGRPFHQPIRGDPKQQPSNQNPCWDIPASLSQSASSTHQQPGPKGGQSNFPQAAKWRDGDGGEDEHEDVQALLHRAEEQQMHPDVPQAGGWAAFMEGRKAHWLPRRFSAVLEPLPALTAPCHCCHLTEKSRRSEKQSQSLFSVYKFLLAG